MDDGISEENDELELNGKYLTNNISNKNKNLKIIQKRKPVSRKMYANLLERMIYIIEKYKDEINEAPNNANTKYNSLLVKYIKDLECKILALKNAYLITSIKKHYCNNEKDKKKIIIQGNIPRKRNEVKICFKELVSFTKNRFKNNAGIQKYYYMQILNILNKYENISDEDIQMAKKLYKENQLDKLNYIEENNIENNKEENVWIRQKKSNSSKIFRIFTVALPLAYIITYLYTNSHS